MIFLSRSPDFSVPYSNCSFSLSCEFIWITLSSGTKSTLFYPKSSPSCSARVFWTEEFDFKSKFFFEQITILSLSFMDSFPNVSNACGLYFFYFYVRCRSFLSIFNSGWSLAFGKRSSFWEFLFERDPDIRFFVWYSPEMRESFLGCKLLPSTFKRCGDLEPYEFGSCLFIAFGVLFREEYFNGLIDWF